jgi:sigma-54 dependent transcriptional regulator, flagellar regulatory protein
MQSEDPQVAGGGGAAAVMLVLPNAESRDYLNNILQFVDCEVKSPDSPGQLQALVERYAEQAASVFISSAL